MRPADVVVIGAGQAGLSAAYRFSAAASSPLAVPRPAQAKRAGRRQVTGPPDVHRARRRGRPGRGLAPPLEEPSHGHGERHQRPSGPPAARRGSCRGQFQFPHPLFRRVRTRPRPRDRAARESAVGEPGGRESRRAADASPPPAARGRPRRHQRHRHLDPAVLAHLSWPGQLPRPATARRRLRFRRGIPRPACHCGWRRDLGRRAAR